MTQTLMKPVAPTIALVLGFLHASCSHSATPVIQPGAVWRDTEGEVIQAHGGGIVQLGGTFYWFGENRSPRPVSPPFGFVKLYSSTDLGRWVPRGNVLMAQHSGDLAVGRMVERPKVIFNRGTRKYVMYMHIDAADYSEARVGVATSDTIDGQYAYLGSFQPFGHQSRDMTLFEDTDRTVYLVYEDRARGVGIAQLSEDALTVARDVALIPRPYEGLAVAKIDGTYFLLGSHLTSWAANPNQYAIATSVEGPWSDFSDIAPPATNTYDSQSTFILPVQGARKMTYVYLGDRWNAARLDDSRYIWMPLDVRNQSVSLPAPRPWTIDVMSGLTRIVQ